MPTRFITTTKTPTIDSAKYSVIILSSIPVGRGLYTTPISMYPVNNRETVLDNQYNSIRNVFPRSDVLIVSGYNTNLIAVRKPKEVRLIENQNYTESSEVEEARLGVNATNTESVIFISGNILFSDETLNQIKTRPSAILIDRKSEEDGSVGTTDDKSKLENMSYGLMNKWCGISHLTGKELELFKHMVNAKSKTKLCLFEIFNLLIRKGSTIYTIDHNVGFLQRNIK